MPRIETLFVIECRAPDGTLDMTGQQPEAHFGIGAITGIDEERMARRVWYYEPTAVLTGDNIAKWPSFVDPRWVARRKTW